MLGMNMKVEKIGIERIKAKISGLKEKNVKKIDDFGDFEKKYEEELKKKEEKKARNKLKPKEINAKIERKLIENGLIEEINEEMGAFGMPMAFSSKKIKK